MSAVASAIVSMGQCDVPYEVLVFFAFIIGIASLLSLPRIIKVLLGLDNNQK